MNIIIVYGLTMYMILYTLHVFMLACSKVGNPSITFYYIAALQLCQLLHIFVLSCLQGQE